MKDKYNTGSMDYHHAQHILDIAVKCRKLNFPGDARRLATLLSDLHFYLEAFNLKDTEFFRQLDKRFQSLKHIPESKAVFENMKEFIEMHAKLMANAYRLKG